ncbi:pilus assembly protein PilM [Candidatus Parcubacteria bacterium]|nr:pilus assembly protein PilM [Candidatus Parcubacteria bacterium]
MRLFDLFPPPRFLTLREAGVSVTERAVKFVSFKVGASGGLRLEKFGEIPLPEGVISGGTIGNKAVLSDVLSRLRNEHGFSFVNATLPEEKAYLFTTTVDKVEYRDLHDAVAFTVEENAPVSLSKSLFSFEILEAESQVKAAVSVLPQEIAESYMEIFEAAGMTPVSFDIESQAVARALVKRGDERSHLIIHLSERKVGLYLVDNEVVQFSSTLSADLSGGGTPEAVAALKSEIRKFFIFWNTRLEHGGVPGRSVENVVLSGPYASDERIVSNIMSDVETPYALGNVWANVFLSGRKLPDMPFDTSLGFDTAIGAALPQSLHAYV